MADVWYKTGTFTTPASGTTVIGSLPGTNPKFIHLTWTNTTTDNTVQAHQQQGHGMSDGVDHDALTVVCADGADTYGRDGRNANWCLIIDPTSPGTDIILGSTAAMNTNDVTLSYTTTTAGRIINYEIWGGAGTTANMIQYGAAVANSPVSHGLNDGGALKPDLVMVMTCGQGHAASSIHSYLSFGIATDDSGIQQWNLHSFFGDNVGNNSGAALTSGDIAGQYDSDFADWDSTITAISTTTVTWTETAGPGADQSIMATLNFQGDGAVGVEVGTFQKSTASAPTTQAMPDFGFTPLGYALATAHLDTLTKPATNTNRIAHRSFGFYDGTDGVVATTVGTAGATGDRASISVDGEVLQGSVALQASGVQFSGTPQAITDSTPDIEWNPNTTGATDDVFIGFYGIEDTVSGPSPITASVTYGFSESPDLNGIGELTESVSLAFSETPLLTGLALITSSVDFAFSESPDLTGLGELAESVVFAFSESPDLTGLGELAESITYAFSETPLLNGLGELAESITYDFALTPELTVEAADITASISYGFSETPVLNGLGELNESITYAFSESPDLSALIDGAASITYGFSESPVLTGLGELAESIIYAFSETPLLNGLGELTESVTFIFSESPNLTGVTVSWETEGFRWRNDDGTEITATWKQDQDVSESIGKELNIRLRVLSDSTSNPPTAIRTLEYKRDDEDDSEWRIV